DEELGVKDDSHKPWKPAAGGSSWLARLRYRKKRIVAVIFVLGLLFFVFSSFTPDLSETTPDLSETTPEDSISEEKVDEAIEPTGPPSKELYDLGKDTGAVDHTYNGRIRFFRLAKSLRAVADKAEFRLGMDTVLFSAANLKSMSALIPMACEMARMGKSYVHFAMNGRDDVSLDHILTLNGVDQSSCEVFWHDARPDYALYSSDTRAESAAAVALGHIDQFIRPKVVITDDLKAEDPTFARGTRTKAKEISTTIIEIPKGGAERMMWLTRLDGAALAAFHQPSVDIIVHVTPASSGSLLRLLKSLNTADYAGMKPPRLIVDLPVEVDPATVAFLEKWKWPPRPFGSPSSESALENSQLIVRHRIMDEKISPERAAIQFLESSFPVEQGSSHVLTLTPQLQLSPLFYHYTRYVLLNYLHSLGSDAPEHLFGFSLDFPKTYLNGSAEFIPPTIDDMHAEYKKEAHTPNIPFLWQAPSESASLFLGSKFREFHSFLGYRIAAQQQRKKGLDGTVSQQYPAWFGYAVEFMRARGYFMLYPGIAADEALAIKHDELSNTPEEYAEDKKEEAKKTDPARVSDPQDGDILEDDVRTTIKPPQSSPESTLVPLSHPLHSILPLNADYPVLSALPILSFAGAKLTASEFLDGISPYARSFRQDVGGCEPDPPNKRRVLVAGSAKDLFCFGDEGEDDWV
ncbi:hypothetical protein EJ05DRAFT_420865, partial [Pseudovirgaria hyperparasitica]